MLKKSSRRTRDRRRTAWPLRTQDAAAEPAHISVYQVPADVARRANDATMFDRIEPHVSDVFIRAKDSSMEGAGIIEGSLVLMRSLPSKATPKPGDIVMVMAVRSGGPAAFILKRWQGLKNGLPELVDGAGNAFPLPADTTEAIPTFVARGAITAF